jgi:hypothetical protein
MNKYVIKIAKNSGARSVSNQPFAKSPMVPDTMSLLAALKQPARCAAFELPYWCMNATNS